MDQNFLDKYGLKANDSIRADARHELMYKEMSSRYECQYVAGGSVQNTLRAVQWIVKRDYCTTFMGAIGDDIFGRIMTDNITEQVW